MISIRKKHAREDKADVRTSAMPDAAMREEATKMLRQIATRFGVEDAYTLSFEQLSPYLDDDGEVVLPKWLSWYI
jgi:hypothetical protein